MSALVLALGYALAGAAAFVLSARHFAATHSRPSDREANVMASMGAALVWPLVVVAWAASRCYTKAVGE